MILISSLFFKQLFDVLLMAVFWCLVLDHIVEAKKGKTIVAVYVLYISMLIMRCK